MNKTKAILLLSAIFLCALTTSTPVTHSQEVPPCDEEVTKEATPDDNGYKARETRCEGFFSRKVSSDPLTLRSFLLATPPTGALPPVLQVSWHPSSQRRIDLQAKALKARTYFQMDAYADGTKGQYDWPTNVPRSGSLLAGEIGFTASFVESNRRVYLPVSLGGQPGNGREVSVALWPEQKLQKVYMSVNAKKGGSSITVHQNQELGEGVYPQQRPIRFSFTLPESGRYELVVAASLDPTGSVSLIIPFVAEVRR